MTEFGAFCFGGERGGREGEDRHAAVIETEFPVLSETPYVCGATIWCWADHAWPSRTRPEWAFGNVAISPFGVNTAHPWIGYRAYVRVGTATTQEDPDQPVLIWP